MRQRTYLLIGTCVVLIIGGALFVGLSQRMTTPSCAANVLATNVRIIIANNTPSQPDVTAQLCDTLTIVNQDTVTREIAFGPHDHHTPYDGITERVLKRGESFTVTLNKAGTYHWHDHIHDEVQGDFTVKK